jgi:hypothetical protein
MRADRELHVRRVMTAAALIGALLLALLGGCGEPSCVRHSDCDPGLVCGPAGACLVPVEPDGGDGDGDASDANDALDAGDAAIDAGATGDAAIDAPASPVIDAAIDAPVDAAAPRALPSSIPDYPAATP